ncbi:MAG: class I SAM-dependent methyltransferase [Spirochaetales bacterium]|nr:class I SAM-dependent methyltransferase [Spirochaetales bacterium]
MSSLIRSRFSAVASEYDNQRKALIPCYDDFYGIIMAQIACREPSPEILDLGAGTGLLTSLIKKKCPNAHISMIDISENMLKAARKRLQGEDHISYICADYRNYEFAHKFHIIVSALSIHHLSHHEKAVLYGYLFTILHHGGIFINGDQFRAPSAAMEERYQNIWKEQIEASKLTTDEKEAAYKRIEMDKTATLKRNIKWLKEAGFVNADVLYKYYNFGVIYAEKP